MSETHTNLLPTEQEMLDWYLSAVKHSMHVEYFLFHLGIVTDDPERPHDLVGPGNKLEWEVASVLALQNRDPKPDFNSVTLPALEIHRQQSHHTKWNNPDPSDPTKPKPGSTDIDMQVGAVDAICSLLENRLYQGGNHSYEQVREVTLTNPAHKVPWMLDLLPKMEALPQPKLELIKSLEDIPNIGLPDDIYRSILARVQTIRVD